MGDSSSHNACQALIASRLLKVNALLTFQSICLIAFFKTLTLSWLLYVWQFSLDLFWLHAKHVLSEQRAVFKRFWPPFTRHFWQIEFSLQPIELKL